MNYIKGFVVDDIAGGNERLYAKYSDGRVCTTGAIKESTSFDKTGRVWYWTDKVPMLAAFIGNYPAPKIIK